MWSTSLVPWRTRRVGSSRANVTTEEEITQFDGETGKKMTINDFFTFLSNVDNVKMSPEGFDSEVRVTCTDKIPNTLLSRMLLCQFCRFGRKLETELIPEERISECIHRFRNHRRSCPHQRTRDSHA